MLSCWVSRKVPAIPLELGGLDGGPALSTRAGPPKESSLVGGGLVVVVLRETKGTPPRIGGGPVLQKRNGWSWFRYWEPCFLPKAARKGPQKTMALVSLNLIGVPFAEQLFCVLCPPTTVEVLQ